MKFPQFETDPDAYYRPYPEFSSRADAIPVHPQIVAENGPDSSHFRYVHGATVTPVCLRVGERRRGVAVPHRLARRPQ